MEHAMPARTPAHLWIVGILSLLWNGFGCLDYTQTRLRNTEWLASMMPGTDPSVVLAHIDAMPFVAQLGWGLGVWLALAGAVLLLMRSRYAVHAFAVSLAGAVLSFAGQYMGPPAPPEMTEGAMKYIPLLIILLAAAQLWYAARQRARGLLR